MAKIDYFKHYHYFQKYNGSLRKYCDSRRPKLNYESTKKTFQRFKKGGKTGTKQSLIDSPKIPKNKLEYSPTKTKVKSEIINLPKLPKGLVISPKHQAVADEFLICLIPAEAYMRVYPNSSYAAAIVSASELLRKPNVALYLEYQRSAARAKTQIELQWINKRRKQIAGTDMRDVADFGADHVDIKDSSDLSADHSAAIKKISFSKKYINVPGADGETQEIIEIKGGVELEDRRRVLDDLEKSLISSNSDSSTSSTDPQVQQWWGEFLNPEEGTPKLSALGFAMRLDSINHSVPPMIKEQAKAELAVLGERALGNDKDDVDVQDRIQMRMDKLKNA